jgi:ABC-type glycerol-3-phosphate transport system permease component
MVKERSAWLKAVVLLLLIVGAFVSIIPFLYMVSHSLKTIAETITRSSAIPFDPKFWPRVPQWSNYRVAWQEARFGLYFRNSVIITAVTVGGIVVTSCLSAYAFAKLRFAGRDLIFAILLSTLMIPQTVLLIPNFVIVAKLGWIDRLPALTVPFLASAFHIFLLRQFFSQIPNELIEVAKIDGATHLRSLISIVVPLSKAPIFTVVFLSFIHTWNQLQWPLVVTQTPRWRPITVGLSVFITEAGPETHLRMAGAVIAVLPVIALYFVAQRQFTEAITRSGIKE